MRNDLELENRTLQSGVRFSDILVKLSSDFAILRQEGRNINLGLILWNSFPCSKLQNFSATMKGLCFRTPKLRNTTQPLNTPEDHLEQTFRKKGNFLLFRKWIIPHEKIRLHQKGKTLWPRFFRFSYFHYYIMYYIFYLIVDCKITKKRHNSSSETLIWFILGSGNWISFTILGSFSFHLGKKKTKKI